MARRCPLRLHFARRDTPGADLIDADDKIEVYVGRKPDCRYATGAGCTCSPLQTDDTRPRADPRETTSSASKHLSLETATTCTLFCRSFALSKLPTIPFP